MRPSRALARPSRQPDTPQFIVGPNAARRGLVHFSIGTAMAGYNITPDRADELATELANAAAAARGTADTASAG